jgi:hypothetical protein
MFNKIVDQLQTMERPTWMPEGSMPRPLPRRSVIDINPDAPLWDDMVMGNVWVSLWGTSYDAAPVYVRDPSVREGIKMVLQQDRVIEEEFRLEEERKNICNEFANSVFVAAEAIQYCPRRYHLCNRRQLF